MDSPLHGQRFSQCYQWSDEFLIVALQNLFAIVKLDWGESRAGFLPAVLEPCDGGDGVLIMPVPVKFCQRLMQCCAQTRSAEKGRLGQSPIVPEIVLLGAALIGLEFCGRERIGHPGSGNAAEIRVASGLG